MILTHDGINLVKKWEGLRLKAYLDPVGVVTIGYGYTNRSGFGSGVKIGDVWTEEMADEMLSIGLNIFADKIRPYFKRDATPEQFSAFVSLAYNIGWQSFVRSTALRKFNEGDIHGAADGILMWNKAGGKVMKGLVNRRKEEKDMFLSEHKSVISQNWITSLINAILSIFKGAK